MRRLAFLTISLLCLVWPWQARAQRSFGGRPFDDESLTLRTRCLGEPVVELPAVNVDSMLRDDAQYGSTHGALRFAYKTAVNLNPDNSGETFVTEDGTKVWRLRLHAQNAYSLNVIFDTFHIPQGAKLFLFNPERSEILGSFTHLNEQSGGDFPIAPVGGDELVIEYQEPASASFEGELQIYEVNCAYRPLRIGGAFQHLDMHCLPHLSCNESLGQLGRSVCLLIMNGDTYCTGTFVNNTRQDGTPYILTAAHCLDNNPSLASRTVVFLNYNSPRCMTSIQASEEFSLSGCQTRALSNEIDFALLELEALPPADYRPYFAGWNIDTLSYKKVPFTCIHHPYGEMKRYAIEYDSLQKTSWLGLDDGIEGDNHWSVYRWETGHTWSGSSGAALFDKDGLVVGTLSGGDSGGDTGCSPYITGDFFSRLYRAWDYYSSPAKQLKHWLDPDDSGTQTLAAYDPWQEEAVQRLSNIGQNDSIQSFPIDGLGYLFGHNNRKIRAFAERFELNGPHKIYGVYLMPHLGAYLKDYPLTVRIMSLENRGTVFAEKTLNPKLLEYRYSQMQSNDKKVFKNKENYLRLDSAVCVDNEFYVAFYLNESSIDSRDEFAMYGALTSENHAYYLQKQWLGVNGLDVFGKNASIWIEPLAAACDSCSSSSAADRSNDMIGYFDRDNRYLYLSTSSTWEENGELRLYDMQGKLLETRIIPKNMPYIPLNKNLPSGLYILRLIADKRSQSLKILL